MVLSCGGDSMFWPTAMLLRIFHMINNGYSVLYNCNSGETTNLADMIMILNSFKISFIFAAAVPY